MGRRLQDLFDGLANLRTNSVELGPQRRPATFEGLDLATGGNEVTMRPPDDCRPAPRRVVGPCSFPARQNAAGRGGLRLNCIDLVDVEEASPAMPSPWPEDPSRLQRPHRRDASSEASRHLRTGERGQRHEWI